MKNLAFAMALLIAALGAVCMLVPSVVVWIIQHVATSGAFYIIAVIRVVFGLILISAAPAARWPKAIRILGVIVLIAGIATALTALLAMDSARATLEWWVRQGSMVSRLGGVLILALGGFVARACAPVRRPA